MTIQDGFAPLHGRVPSSDKQCSVRDAKDVLTPARTRSREMCEMGLACQTYRGQTNNAALPKVQIMEHLWLQPKFPRNQSPVPRNSSNSVPLQMRYNGLARVFSMNYTWRHVAADSSCKCLLCLITAGYEITFIQHQ